MLTLSKVPKSLAQIKSKTQLPTIIFGTPSDLLLGQTCALPTC
jgi:hypothetical protein